MLREVVQVLVFAILVQCFNTLEANLLLEPELGADNEYKARPDMVATRQLASKLVRDPELYILKAKKLELDGDVVKPVEVEFAPLNKLFESCCWTGRRARTLTPFEERKQKYSGIQTKHATSQPELDIFAQIDRNLRTKIPFLIGMKYPKLGKKRQYEQNHALKAEQQRSSSPHMSVLLDLNPTTENTWKRFEDRQWNQLRGMWGKRSVESLDNKVEDSLVERQDFE